jgi:F0F1-type ATP synthase membrane subunit c/vacuolar-type H+-ATPase subunit K
MQWSARLEGTGSVTSGRSNPLDDGSGPGGRFERPAFEAAAAVTGALFVLFGAISALFPPPSPLPVYGASGGRAELLGGLGVVSAVALIALAVAAYSRPEKHRALGTAVLLASLAGLACGWGGFGIGTALGVVGAYLILSVGRTPRIRGAPTDEEIAESTHPMPGSPDVASIHYKG